VILALSADFGHVRRRWPASAPESERPFDHGRVTIKTMRAALNHERIVRVMPNTPAQIGRGVSVWTATERSTLRSAAAQAILEALGVAILFRRSGTSTWRPP